MPRIVEYTAADRRLTIPGEGVAAFETAARRIGPAYEQAARSTEDQGRLTAQEYKERLWPWDILELYNAQNKAASSRNSGGFRTAGGNSDPFGQFATHGQTSRAGAAIGDLAAARPDQLKRSDSKLFDVGAMFPNPTAQANKGPAQLPPGMQPDNKTQVPGLYDPGREVWQTPLPPVGIGEPGNPFYGPPAPPGYGPSDVGPPTQGDPSAPTPDYSNSPVPLPQPIQDFNKWAAGPNGTGDGASTDDFGGSF